MIEVRVSDEMAGAFRDAILAWQSSSQTSDYRLGCEMVLKAVLSGQHTGSITWETNADAQWQEEAIRG